MPYDIVTGVSVPPRQRERKYNVDNLEVGQAIIIPGEEKFTQSALYTAARSLGIKLAIRKMPFDDDKGRWKAGDTGVFREA